MDPSLVLINGVIHTMDDVNPKAEAVAILQTRISAVGKNVDILEMVGAHTRVIDLKGKTVLPGFIDSHIHFLSYALRTQAIDLDGVDSLPEVLDRVKERAEHADPGEWIYARSWNKNRWKSKCHPTKYHLDEVSPDNPVVIKSKDGHTLWINSVALAHTAISSQTPNPPGGIIEREEKTGEATGIVKETATQYVELILPHPTQTTIDRALQSAIQSAHTFGITSIHAVEGKDAFQAYQRLLAKDELKLRVYILAPIEILDSALTVGLMSGFGNEKLRFGRVKIFADGALGSQTAAMLESYDDDPNNFGVVVTGRNTLKSLITRAGIHGISPAIHAIGDRANRFVLDIIDDVVDTGWGKNTRFRIEHAQHIRPEDTQRFGQNGIIASVQPAHILLDMDIAENYLGARSQYAYPIRTLHNVKANLAFGSDCPVMSLNPLLGIYAAVTRKRINGIPLNGWYPEESITVHEAVRAYTLGAAYASGEEQIKGSITPGKLADLVVLSDNIFEISGEAVLDVKVDATIFDGEIVFKRETD